MSQLRICRICLNSNVKMHQISGSEVQDVYEKLINKQVKEDGMPYFACYLCYCQLKKSRQLVIKSRKSEELLKDILLNLKSIDSIDQQSYGFANLLKVSNVEYLQIPECHKNIKIANHTVEVVVNNEVNVNDEVIVNDELVIKDEVRPNDEVVVNDEVMTQNEVFVKIEVMEEDQPDDWSHTSKDYCKLDEKHNFIQNKLKSMEVISGAQRNEVGKENESFKIECLKNLKHISEGELKKSDTIQKENLRTHTKREKPFKCKFCTYACRSNANLKTHILMHTGEKPFMCEYCDYGCTSKYYLKMHIKGHTGENPFKCEYCNYTFRSNSDLKRHNRTHTGEKPFECDYCYNKYSSNASLKIHIRTHTGEKPFKCANCSYTCSSNSRLKIHIRTHTVDKPYKCEFCVFTFRNKSDLKRHNKTHTGEKPFKCELCNYTCRTGFELRRHKGRERSCRPEFWVLNQTRSSSQGEPSPQINSNSE